MYVPVNDYLRRNGINFRYKTPVRTIEEVLTLIKEDEGISILPRPAIMNAFKSRKITGRPIIREGEIDYISVKPYFERPIAIIYRDDSHKKNLIGEFLGVLNENKERPSEADDNASSADSPKL